MTNFYDSVGTNVSAGDFLLSAEREGEGARFRYSVAVRPQLYGKAQQPAVRIRSIDPLTLRPLSRDGFIPRSETVLVLQESQIPSSLLGPMIKLRGIIENEHINF